MSARSMMSVFLRQEVSRVEQGTESLTMLRERQSERQAERSRLRSLIDQSHPELPGAVKRRRRVM